MAIEYAVRHPERVSHLVILGGFVRGWAKRSPDSERAGRAWVEMVRVGWGARSTGAYRRMFAELFIPSATEEHMAWFDELQRRTTTPEIAARIMEVSGNIDVAHRLAEVKTPALVIHSRGDVIVPFEQGRVIAAGIPDARFVELNSANHLLLENEPAWQKFQEVVGEFLGWRRLAPSAASPMRRVHPKNWRRSVPRRGAPVARPARRRDDAVRVRTRSRPRPRPSAGSSRPASCPPRWR